MKIYNWWTDGLVTYRSVFLRTSYEDAVTDETCIFLTFFLEFFYNTHIFRFSIIAFNNLFESNCPVSSTWSKKLYQPKSTSFTQASYNCFSSKFRISCTIYIFYSLSLLPRRLHPVRFFPKARQLPRLFATIPWQPVQWPWSVRDVMYMECDRMWLVNERDDFIPHLSISCILNVHLFELRTASEPEVLTKNYFDNADVIQFFHPLRAKFWLW